MTKLAPLIGRVLAVALLAAVNSRAAEREGVLWTNVPRQVLAFYYGWYGNEATSGHLVHWEKVDDAKKQIAASTHYPQLGA